MFSNRESKNSRFLMVIGLYLALCLVILVVFPWTITDAVAALPVMLRPSVAKLDSVLHSSSAPEVVLLGSSLMARPLARVDDQAAGKRARYDPWYTDDFMARYDKARHLEELLEKHCHRHVNVMNAALFGAMVSDDFLVLEKILSSGKRPALVILGVSPRDFLANDAPRLEQSPVFRILAQPLDLINLDEVPLPSNGVDRDLQRRGVLMFEHLRERLHKMVCNYTLRPLIGMVGQVSWLDPSPPSTSVFEDKPNYLPKADKLPDLFLYNYRYNPPDTERFSRQAEYFERLLQVCHRSSIQVMIADMPLTAENQSLIPSKMKKRFAELMVDAASRWGARLLEFRAGFTHQDFDDSCHLNAAGGKKLCLRLSESIAAKLAPPRSLACNRSESE